ncbi:MAG: TGS domain-containing protein, partial [Solibacillus sp.]
MSEMIQLTFPDGNVKAFEKGSSTLDVAGSISPGLKKSALAGKVNGTLVDAKTPIEEDAH